MFVHHVVHLFAHRSCPATFFHCHTFLEQQIRLRSSASSRFLFINLCGFCDDAINTSTLAGAGETKHSARLSHRQDKQRTRSRAQLEMTFTFRSSLRRRTEPFLFLLPFASKTSCNAAVGLRTRASHSACRTEILVPTCSTCYPIPLRRRLCRWPDKLHASLHPRAGALNHCRPHSWCR